jgi:transposase
MRDYFALYAGGGLDQLKEVNLYRPTSALEAHTTTLEAYFRDHPPATIKEAQHEIETLTGIKRSETQVRTFLKKTPFAVSQSWHDPGQSRSRATSRLSPPRT